MSESHAGPASSASGDDSESSKEDQERETVLDVWRTSVGGLIATGIALTLTLGVGQVSPYEVRDLLQPFIDALCYFCSAMCTASGTIVALMLTALGLSAQSDQRFNEFHYRRLRFIARMATIVFVLAALLLLMIGIPFERADAIPRSFHTTVYYVVTIYASILCGFVVSTVLMLYRTVAETIEAVGLARDDHPIIASEE